MCSTHSLAHGAAHIVLKPNNTAQAVDFLHNGYESGVDPWHAQVQLSLLSEGVVAISSFSTGPLKLKDNLRLYREKFHTHLFKKM